MKMLIVTQSLDKSNPILGFFHDWVTEFARQCDSIIVICLEKGDFTVPSNVKVFSLGKEKKLGSWVYLKNFFGLAWKFRKEYDLVFVHMNPIYLLLYGLIWRIQKKKIGLWYTHRAVTRSLKIAEKFTNWVFTASDDSFLINTPKKRVVGHGFDVSKFLTPFELEAKKRSESSIISVGRITPIKDLNTLLLCLKRLVDNNELYSLTLVGGPITLDDLRYEKEVVALAENLQITNLVTWVGRVKNSSLPEYLWKHNFLINLSPTGGIDKVVLEAMASGCLIVAANTAFAHYFGPYANRLLFKYGDPNDLARKIEALNSASDKELIRSYLQKTVIEKNNLSRLISLILSVYVGSKTTS